MHTPKSVPRSNLVRSAFILGGICILLASIGLQYIKRTKRIVVEITPLARLEIPPDMALPRTNRTDIGIHQMVGMHGFLAGDVLVQMWRNPEVPFKRTLACGGDDRLIVTTKSDGKHFYCETIADEQISVFPTGRLGVFDSNILIQKGDVFIYIVNYGDKTPDGKSEEAAVDMLARVWNRRIQSGTHTEFFPGEFSYENWCAECHSLDGTPATGPTFLNLFESEVNLADGHVVRANETYILNSILNPGEQVVAGFSADGMPELDAMPVAWRLEPAVNDLVNFITSVKSP